MKKHLTLFLSLSILLSTVLGVVPASAATTEGYTPTVDTYYRANEVYNTPILTFEAVIKIPAENASVDCGYIMGTHGFSGDFYNFRINANCNPHLYVRDQNGTHDEYRFSKVSLPTDQWVHLALVRNNELDVMQCFVNGVYKQSIALSGKTYIMPRGLYVIGGSHEYLNLSYFKGSIKSIATYSDVRTWDEITADAASSTVDTDNLISHYDFSSFDSSSDTVSDLSGNGYDCRKVSLWMDEMPAVDDYDFSMAVIGDQQYLNRLFPDDMPVMYQSIVDHADDYKLKYVFNLGDITDKSTDAEWERAAAGFDMLTAANIPYSFVRGNHDVPISSYNSALPYSKYGENIVDGTYTGETGGTDDLTSYYRKIEIEGIKYLMLTLDYSCDYPVLDWANEVISAHPDYNVIVTTHAYLNPVDYFDTQPYQSNAAADVYSTGQDMWDLCFSQHENVMLVLNGHVLSNDIRLRKDVGVHGNTVTSMIINPQGIDEHGFYKNVSSQGYEHGSGLVSYFFFSNGGRDVQVRYYSTTYKRWYRSDSQFSTEFDLLGDDNITNDTFESTAKGSNVQNLVSGVVDKIGAVITENKVPVIAVFTLAVIAGVGITTTAFIKKKHRKQKLENNL